MLFSAKRVQYNMYVHVLVLKVAVAIVLVPVLYIVSDIPEFYVRLNFIDQLNG